MNEIREHLKRKFGLSDEDYNTLVQAEKDNPEREINVLRGRVGELEKGVGTSGKASEKGISKRLDDIEARISALEDGTA